MCLLAIDLGGTSVKYGLYRNDELIEKSSFSTPKNLQELKDKIGAILSRFQKKYVIEGIAVSTPGTVDIEKRMIKGISAIPYIHNFDIFTDFEKEFGLPVSFENDANCAGICEMRIGSGAGYKNAIFIVIGTAVGGAIFIDGKLHRGKHLFAGEFGLLLNGELIYSETASAVKMANRYNAIHGESKSGEEIFELARQGNSLAMESVDSLYLDIAKCIYNIQVTLDPEVFIIGGGMSRNKDIVVEIEMRTRKLLAKQNLDFLMSEIKLCKYDNDANLLGAVLVFKEIRKND